MVGESVPMKDKKPVNTSFGSLLKQHRQSLGKTLREFCLENGFDPGNHSRLERGLYPPPEGHDLIEKYALAADLIPGTDDWIEFFDTAALERGNIPTDLMADKEVVEKLPVLFRTLRAQRVTPESLNDLVEKIRRS